MIRNFTFLVLLFSAHLLHAQKVNYIFIDVYFKTDKFDLRKSEKEKIKMALDTLDKDRIKIIQMAGHTDSRADSVYNIALSKKRATSVADYFLELGVEKEKIKPWFYGENKPRAENVSETGLQKNRRVEIRISYALPKPPPPVVVRVDSAVIKIRDTCANHDTVVSLKSGIKFQMTKCNWEKMKNCIELEEINTAAEVASNRLSMKDEQGNLLESQGMFRLKWAARCGDCADFSLDWLLTKEEYETMGFSFYEFSSATNRWGNLPKREIKRVVIGGTLYYKVKIDCSDFDRWWNCDRIVGIPVMKIKNKTDWEMVDISTDTTSEVFFYNTYDTTENIDRRKIWKVPPRKNIGVALKNKTTGEFLIITFNMLKPARFKLFRHGLVKGYLGGLQGNNPFNDWPHLNTMKVSIHKDNKKPYYYKKYKITKRVLRRALNENKN